MTSGISFGEHLATEAAIEDDVRGHRAQRSAELIVRVAIGN